MRKQATYSILHEVLLEVRSLSPVTQPDNSVHIDRKIGKEVKEVLLNLRLNRMLLVAALAVMPVFMDILGKS
jgi:hypothetical protein